MRVEVLLPTTILILLLSGVFMPSYGYDSEQVENKWYLPFGKQIPPTPISNQEIESALVLSGDLELGKKFTVIYKVKSLAKLPSDKSHIKIVFPPKAFEILDYKTPKGGEVHKAKSALIWVGSIKPNQSLEMSMDFKVVNEGWGTIYGTLNSRDNNSQVIDVKIAELRVDKYGGKLEIVESWRDLRESGIKYAE